MSEMQNHTVHFSFDTTPEQAAIIQQKMKNAGVKNKSGFFRAMVLNGYLLRLDLPELREASRQMSILSMKQKSMRSWKSRRRLLN